MKNTQNPPAKGVTVNNNDVENPNEAMINYLSKEIETMSNNTIQSRNRISFSLWIGPFLLVGSLIVGREKGGYGFATPGLEAWVILIVASLLFFILIAFIIGQIEAGAWVKCNKWRECIVLLHQGKKFKDEDLLKMVKYEELAKRVTWAYFYVFAISFILIGAIVYFISQLLRFTPPAGN